MLKRYSVWLLLMTVLYILQSSFFPLIAINGVGPDLLLLFVVMFAFLYGSRHGIWMGFMAGLLQDLASGAFFGVNIFCKMLIGYGCGSFSKRVFKEQLLLPIVAVVLASTVNFFLNIGFYFLLGYQIDIQLLVERYYLFMMFMNVLPALLIHFVVHRTDKALKEIKQ